MLWQYSPHGTGLGRFLDVRTCGPGAEPYRKAEARPGERGVVL